MEEGGRVGPSRLTKTHVLLGDTASELDFRLQLDLVRGLCVTGGGNSKEQTGVPVFDSARSSLAQQSVGKPG